MTTSPLRPPSAPSPPTRLNGWKEIAAYFGKGVRTAQRWEKELGLPVRRLGTGRGEIVFAFVTELETWRKAAEKRVDLTSQPGEDEAPEPRDVPLREGRTFAEPTRRRGARVYLLIALAAVLVSAAATWWAVRGAWAQPYEARIENHALRVYDENGRFLWEHRFEFPLQQSPASEAFRALHPASIIEDIDGDGSREVLFITNQESHSLPGGLFCFDRRGKLRFKHVVHRRVTFGGVPATGPWHPLVMTVVPDGPGRKAIWAAFVDRNQFPCVVEKIDGAGRTLNEFWSPGNVTALLPVTFRGRTAMLIAGSDNEFNGVGVAVVDRANPTGSAPAVRAKFTCQGCPTAAPLEFVVFPGTEIERLQDSNLGMDRIEQGDQGELTFVVLHVLSFESLAKGLGFAVGRTHMIFDRDLQPLSAQHQPDFRTLHNEAFRRGVLDHPFGPADDAVLWPVLRWNGAAFEELRPSASR